MVDFVGIGLWFWELFVTWLKTIFVIPVQNVDMLWLLIPIWATWGFAEFFQEKQGTSMGNAITNSVVVIWGSIDCTRQTFRLISSGQLDWGFNVYLRFLLILLILIYGVIIVVLGLKGNKVIKYIGRVREVTYVFAMFVPVFYNAVDFTLTHVLAAVLFLPIFYFTIELIDRYTPDPKAVVEDMQEAGKEGAGEAEAGGLGGLGGESKETGLDREKTGTGGIGESGSLGAGGLSGGGSDDFKL